MEVTMKLSDLKPINDKASARRKVVIASLENQLKIGTKPNRGTTKEKKDNPRIPITDKDRSRIEKEIEVLKTRV